MPPPHTKLIEVALPLDAINAASASEKSIRHGHPSTLHLWWARRPLAAARAVIFTQMVDDPSEWPDLFPTEQAQEQERRRLFGIIEELVKWKNTTNEQVLQAARDEIWASWRRTCADNDAHPRADELFDPDKLPAFHDPFAGGGALPLEAQRLGLEVHASDLNPVAVLINKAMIEIPAKFAGKPPVNPDASRAYLGTRASRPHNIEQNPVKAGLARVASETPAFPGWKGAQGLAADVRHYGKWMREEAEKRIGHLYPKIEITAEMVQERPDLKKYAGRKLNVIAWLWARTVTSPNPAFRDVAVPLASTFMLSTKKGKEAYVKPVLEEEGYRFAVKVGTPEDPEAAKAGTKLSRGANFRCLMSGTPIAGDYIKAEGRAGRMGARLMAIVAEGDRGRVYLAPTLEHEERVRKARPGWKPENDLIGKCRDQLPLYGMTTFADLFTSRQLVALTTFSDLVTEVMERVKHDALGTRASDPLEHNAGGTPAFPGDETPLRDGGVGATAYAEAVGVYLAFAVDRSANSCSSLSRWQNTGDFVAGVFARQAIPMLWDYAEVNIFSSSTQNWMAQVEWVAKAVETLPSDGHASQTFQADAAFSSPADSGFVISTDPPYYDNVGYADLSDFFYVWLRRSLRPVFSDLFATLSTPKAGELVATPYRHGSKDKAEAYFLDGMKEAMRRLAKQTHPAFPITIYYAFKQSEKKGDTGTASTGWETFLAAVIESGFAVTGTWPVRTERKARSIGIGANALASSVVLVCRSRSADAPTATRRQFVTALEAELPPALAHLQSGNIPPVDLAQAAIGPGMAVYTRYAKVLDASGKPVSVRDALTLINEVLDEALTEQEGDFDADSRWALAWFEQHGFAPGEYGLAETLSMAKNTSVAGLAEAGILAAKGGRVQLLTPDQMSTDWDPARDGRLTAWKMVHHLIRALKAGGEVAAADLTAKLYGKAEMARELCYRLYRVCERKKRAADALAYNGLVQSWPEISRLAQAGRETSAEQQGLFGEG